MKTAMQELKDWANQYKGQMISADQVVLQAHNLLKKEKEQIKEAWYNGGVNGMGLFETNTGEEYYNETYFQQEDKTFKQKSKWTSVDNTKH
jgi:hypothetical protein